MRLIPAAPLGVTASQIPYIDALGPTESQWSLDKPGPSGTGSRLEALQSDPWAEVGGEPDPEELIRLEGVLGFLDPITADFIDLRFKVGLTQSTIASLFGCSQPTVQYHCQSGIAQARILLRRPEISYAQMRGLIKRSWQPPREYVTRDGGWGITWQNAYRVALIYWHCRSQSETGRRMGKSQGWVRNYIQTTIGNLNRLGEPLATSFAASLGEILHVKVRVGEPVFHKRLIFDV